MPIYSEAAKDAANRKGLLNASGRVSRVEVAKRLVETLKERHAVNALDEVTDRAATLDQLTVEVFDANEPELRFLVSQLTTTAHDGPVQQRLNGQVLCSQRVEKAIQINGTRIMKPHNCRFVSSSPDVLKAYLVDPRAERLYGHVMRQKALLELAVRRVPALQPHVQEAVAELAGRVQAALTAPGERAS